MNEPKSSPAGSAPTDRPRGPEGSDAALSRDEFLRYARHLALPEMGLEGQLKLRDARVLCVGAGGLGSPLLLYLAAAGVGTLGMVDFDEVDATNLQRQLLYGTRDLGRSKLEAATERLRDVNPHVDLVRHPVRLTSENALDVLGDYDVVVDGTDNFPTRYLVNDACVLLGKPNVFGSVFRWEGQVSLFGAPDGPCYRCLFREPPPPELVQNCAEGGVLGVLPGIIGTVQAMETIKWILGVGDSLVGRLLLFSALEMSWREIELRKNPDCIVCGEDPSQTGLIDYELFCGVDASGESDGPELSEIPETDVATLVRGLDSAAPPLVVDVREDWEWELGNLAGRGARHLPLKELERGLDQLPRDRPLVVTCRSGGRSARATRVLIQAGFSDVRSLRGGMLAWAAEVDSDLVVV